MRLALAQVDSRVGDLAANVDTILGAAEAAAEAELVVFPELVLTGYPPRDLLLDPGFVRDTQSALRQLARSLADGPPVLLGAPLPSGRSTPGHPGLWNAAVWMHQGRLRVRPKRLLPAYDVFHEPRWFHPGSHAALLPGRVGALVCEDLWSEGYPLDPAAELRGLGAELLVSLNASPFRQGILDQRLAVARRAGGPLVYLNAVGANDELIFDGRSFVLDSEGELLARLPAFQEAVELVELDSPAPRLSPADDLEILWEALVCGVRGFCHKNGLRQAWLGLSGGVDSALVACLAVDALGPDAVRGLALPGRYTDPRSTEAAQQLARTLGIRLEVLHLEPLHRAGEALLGGLLHDAPAHDTTAENLQARLRTVLIAAHLNRHGGVLLNTSNKTELSLGYGTLWGDLAGSLSPIGDLTKPQVQALARWTGRIPRFVLDRAPSAELRPDQRDPFDYEALSPRVEEQLLGSAPVDRDGLALARRIHAAEHKRWQQGVVLKVSERAFGSGRMVPITRAAPALEAPQDSSAETSTGTAKRPRRTGHS